jgi:hypothetical protein
LVKHFHFAAFLNYVVVNKVKDPIICEWILNQVRLKMKKIILTYKICQQHLGLMGNQKRDQKENRQSIQGHHRPGARPSQLRPP